MSSPQRVPVIPYLAIGYLAVLLHFVFLGLVVFAMASSAGVGDTAAFGVGWLVSLVVAVASFVLLAKANRRGAYPGAKPVAQLLSPLESKARVDRYRARYQGRSGAGVSRLPARNDVAVERDAA